MCMGDAVSTDLKPEVLQLAQTSPVKERTRASRSLQRRVQDFG